MDTGTADGSTCTGASLAMCSGACVDLASDERHCGACGATCAFTNAVASCEGRVCQLVDCLSGYTDCDGVMANGCERTGSCPCTTDAECGAGRYCWTGACQPSPVVGATPWFGEADLCGDFGVDRSPPAYVYRFTLICRPGAALTYFTRHSCWDPGASVVYTNPLAPTVCPASGSASWDLAGPADTACTSAPWGRVWVWAQVDGRNSNMELLTFYNSYSLGASTTCVPEIRTCAAAATFCAPQPVSP